LPVAGPDLNAKHQDQQQTGSNRQTRESPRCFSLPKRANDADVHGADENQDRGQADDTAFVQAIAPRMAEQDWLGSYRDFAVMEQVVAAMSRRLSRPEGLAGGMAELERLYVPLQRDFRTFYPQLQAFARSHGASTETAQPL